MTISHAFLKVGYVEATIALDTTNKPQVRLAKTLEPTKEAMVFQVVAKNGEEGLRLHKATEFIKIILSHHYCVPFPPENVLTLSDESSSTNSVWGLSNDMNGDEYGAFSMVDRENDPILFESIMDQIHNLT